MKLVTETELVEVLELEGPPVPAKGLFVEYTRDLSLADLAAARGTNRCPPPKSLIRIHSSHHSLARCLAAGMRPGQAALVTGYSLSRISILQNDPSFTALVEDYKTEAKSVFANLAERMNDLSLDAIEILHERLADSPETFTVPVLLDLVKAFADRTGHGPNQEVHLKMSTDLIDRPPRETYEDWQARRAKELTGPEGPTAPTDDVKKLN